MRTIVKGATVPQAFLAGWRGAAHGSDEEVVDIVIDGDRIDAIEPSDTVPIPAALAHPDRIIDAAGRLLIPGLVNAHLHSWEALLRGRYDAGPLELWALKAYPVLAAVPLDPELVYLRTMLVAMESLKSGVTCVVDDVIEMPSMNRPSLDATFAAYADSGIRANCSGNMIDRHYHDTIPGLRHLLPDDLIGRIEEHGPPNADRQIEFATEALREHHGRLGRLRYVLAPSAPQRCTPELLQESFQLAEAWDAGFHTHVLETRLQELTGQVMYGRTIVEYMRDLEILSPRTTIAHGIWVSDSDIELLGAAGCSVAHNPISNLKLGAGIAPFRSLVEAGVNVALGTDGLSSNDSSRMFDVMRVAALVHRVSTPDHKDWPTAEEVAIAATSNGARSAGLEGQVGEIKVGAKADLVLLDLNGLNFAPGNDLMKHLVYCENGASVDTVMVNGDVVVSGGSMTTVDEEAILAELRASMPHFKKYYSRVERLNDVLRPYLERVYQESLSN